MLQKLVLYKCPLGQLYQVKGIKRYAFEDWAQVYPVALIGDELHYGKWTLPDDVKMVSSSVPFRTLEKVEVEFRKGVYS